MARVSAMDMLASPEGTTSDLRADWRQKRRTGLARERMMMARAFREEGMTAQLGRRGDYLENLLGFEKERLKQQGTQFGKTMEARGTEFKGVQDWRMAGRGIEESAEERMAAGQQARIDWQAGGEGREERRFQREDPIGAKIARLLAEDDRRSRGARETGIAEDRGMPGGDIEPRRDIFSGPMGQIIRAREGVPTEGQRKLTEAHGELTLTQIQQAQRGLADPMAQRTPGKMAELGAMGKIGIQGFQRKLTSLKSFLNRVGPDDIQSIADEASKYAKQMQQLGAEEWEITEALMTSLKEEMDEWTRWWGSTLSYKDVREQLRAQVGAAVKRAFLGGAETAIQEAGVRRAQPAPQFGAPALPGPGGGATPADIRLG